MDLLEKAAGCLDRLSEESLCSLYKVTAEERPGSKMFASLSLTTRSNYRLGLSKMVSTDDNFTCKWWLR